MATPSKKTMFNYFTKLPSKTSIVEENPRKTAPIFNKQHVQEFQAKISSFDDELLNPTGETNYLLILKSSKHTPHNVIRKRRGSLRARLLQFVEDVRPPYFGTWQKESKNISGRKPFALDTENFDYEVDSEAEWDIGGPGESLKGDDSEDDEEPDDYEIDMKTFVPHGYVSDDEVDENSDNEKSASENATAQKDPNIENDSDSDIQIISDTRTRIRQEQQQQQAPIKQTPKMDIKAITVGLNFEDNPTVSETKLQFLKAFEGVSCN